MENYNVNYICNYNTLIDQVETIKNDALKIIKKGVLTIDEKEDFKAIESLISNLGAERGWKEYANFIEKNPTLFKNQKIIRNSGYLKSLSNDKST